MILPLKSDPVNQARTNADYPVEQGPWIAYLPVAGSILPGLKRAQAKFRKE